MIPLRESPGNATVLTLLHERLEQLAEGMPYAADNVEMGWNMVLEKLNALMEGGGPGA